MSKFYSNGKLLLSGEYLVLDGAIGLALPTTFGQEMILQESTSEGVLLWHSLDDKGKSWFEGNFSLPNLELISYKGDKGVATTLQRILLVAKKANNHFLSESNGLLVTTNLQFPAKWGLGSSSTLINNIAQWASVNSYELLWNAFSGSGYDIACAQHDTSIFYQLVNQQPKVEPTNFNPSFKDQLYFVHLNQKQNSREGIKRYKEKRGKIEVELDVISDISKELSKSKKLSEFEGLIRKHENIISNIIELPTIQETLFSDYFGVIKSLGAWGGDFILATGDQNTLTYFKEKGYTTVLSYSDMVL